ncbi:sigma-54-dependent Fis family transcriptional regulator [bacterium]|nr:sigma-54-dependent Fis family transcriptional regulator [candidate division CSSED10-310 bacterium]
MRILVVEDNSGMQRMLDRVLKKSGYDVTVVSDGEAAVHRMRENNYFAVISDLKLPGIDGLAVLKAAKQADERTITIIITAFGSVETAVQAMKDGADDFLTKPFDTNLLLMQLEKGRQRYQLLNENALLRDASVFSGDMPVVIGNSPVFQPILDQIQRVGPLDSAVLLQGESGTGKEILARMIHALSHRRQRHFVAINCAAIPHDLLENELFGHERGAFTGADRRKPGKFELADGGTVFLDEIGDMAPALQAKVLRFLQEKQFERVGGNATLTVNVRVIAATNRNLKEHVRSGQFREDLFYRLSVFPIEIPPLRDRPEDITLLVDHFLDHFRREFRKSNLRLGPQTLDRLIRYSWPGNVRELQNCIERAAILTPDGIIRTEHIAVNPVRDVKMVDLQSIPMDGSLQDVMSAVRYTIEKKLISETLKRNGWNRSQSARDLGINYKTLLHKIKEFGIE